MYVLLAHQLEESYCHVLSPALKFIHKLDGTNGVFLISHCVILRMIIYDDTITFYIQEAVKKHQQLLPSHWLVRGCLVMTRIQ